ncbi:hypothetical protein K435DRAFT_70788 [Dendrothele bispora CBS 962.96]|uniref:Uncharacterized protein n=1 Tax=Dendrothele bispora (strain CBS 962.96) TaxID=1314807 RepID=A0A4S8KRH4_DENBC|nr:hypothetical protein K435DRAFT_70788 [Dendrothele bispora CBS 962.96]
MRTGFQKDDGDACLLGFVSSCSIQVGLLPGESPAQITTWNLLHVGAGDWYHDQHSDLLDQFINIANSGGAEPVPDSALIHFSRQSFPLEHL